jgi:peptidoglycan/xylan/chitin deacetylase (PgdA/CDA1 family)
MPSVRSLAEPTVLAERVRTATMRLARGPAADGLVRLIEQVAPWRQGILAVLTYHRVDEPDARPDLLPGLLSATPAAFEAQVRCLADRYRPVSMAEVLEGAGEPARLPRRAVLVTFDDAYSDFAIHAWPILQAAGVPVTLFVPTAYPGRQIDEFWWDRLWEALRSTARTDVLTTPAGNLPLETTLDRTDAMRELRTWLKRTDDRTAMGEVDRLVAELDASGDHPGPAAGPAVLDWDELRRLAAEGVTLAAHTRTHPLLDRVDLDRAVAEIAGSHEDLEREFGAAPRVLAYPSGAHGGSAVEAARLAGMTLAFTTERGGNDLRHADPLRLRRINVGLRAGTPLIRGQLVWASTIGAKRR